MKPIGSFGGPPLLKPLVYSHQLRRRRLRQAARIIRAALQPTVVMLGLRITASPWDATARRAVRLAGEEGPPPP